MQTVWITKAATHYKQELIEQRQQRSLDLRKQDMEQVRLDRIVAEGPGAGAKLWGQLRAIIKSDAADFNKEFGEVVMRVEDRADGTFKAILVDDTGSEKIAVMKFDQAKAVLTWKVFGGVEGTPLTVGLSPNQDSMQPPQHDLQFTSGNTYYAPEDLSRMLLLSLLP